MPRPPSYQHPLRTIRQATSAGTQDQFAKLVGVSRPTIQAIENGKLVISRRIALRVERATGADHRELLKGPVGKPLDVTGAVYGAAFFKQWRRARPAYAEGDSPTGLAAPPPAPGSGNEEVIDAVANQLAYWTRMLVRASSTSTGDARLGPNRLGRISHAVAEALQQVFDELSLDPEVQPLLTPLKRTEYASAPAEQWEAPLAPPSLRRALKGLPQIRPDTRISLSLAVVPRWNPATDLPESRLSEAAS